MNHLWDAGSLDVWLHHDLLHGVCATGEGMLNVKWPFSVLKNDKKIGVVSAHGRPAVFPRPPPAQCYHFLSGSAMLKITITQAKLII